MTYQFWTSEKTRVESIKKEFEGADNITFIEMGEDGEDGAEVILTDPSNTDLLRLFHAGISFGIDRTHGKI